MPGGQREPLQASPFPLVQSSLIGSQQGIAAPGGGSQPSDLLRA
jgi:hypothetical protein